MIKICIICVSKSVLTAFGSVLQFLARIHLGFFSKLHFFSCMCVCGKIMTKTKSTVFEEPSNLPAAAPELVSVCFFFFFLYTTRDFVSLVFSVFVCVWFDFMCCYLSRIAFSCLVHVAIFICVFCCCVRKDPKKISDLSEAKGDPTKERKKERKKMCCLKEQLTLERGVSVRQRQSN